MEKSRIFESASIGLSNNSRRHDTPVGISLTHVAQIVKNFIYETNISSRRFRQWVSLNYRLALRFFPLLCVLCANLCVLCVYITF